MPWLDRLTAKPVVGDLFSLDVVALVCNLNTNMGLNYKLGRQLHAKLGLPFAQAVRSVVASLPDQKLPLGEAVAMPLASSLGVIRVVVFCGWWDADNEYTDKLIYVCVVNSLRQAFKHRIGSMAFPLLRTGSGQVGQHELSAVIVRAFRDLDALGNSDTFPVENVIFCSDRESVMEELREILDKAGI
ncbi:MAG: macro domain-containing protein [Defluviicoccus sp.]